MEINKKELCNILNISKEALKKIENKGQLKERLNKKGYNYISKYKKGRQVLYIIEQENSYKEIYSNMTECLYKTKKEKEFSKYFTLRTKSLVPISKKDLSLHSLVSTRTVSKWDNILLDNKIISKDGFFYFCIEGAGDAKIIRECSKEEYKIFFKNKAYKQAFKELELKYIKGLITLTELTLASGEIGAIRAATENKYYYRVNKYKTNKDNQLYLDTSELIKILYGYGEKEIQYSNLKIELN